MTTPGQRLRQARLEAGFPTIAEAARVRRLHKQNLADHEAGRRKLSVEWAERYACAFAKSPGWLLTGEGTPRGRLSIMGYVGAGAEVFPLEETEILEIEVPPGAQDSDVAFIIRGDSQYPFADGGVIVARPVNNVHDVLNRMAVVDLADGRRLFKQISAGPTPDTFNLLSHNAAPILGVRVIRAAAFRVYVDPNAK